MYGGDDAERERLLREGLGAAGARGGRVGGPAARAGGRFGGRLSARWLPTRHHEEEVELPNVAPEDLPVLVSDVLAHHGRTVGTGSDGRGGVSVRGVIGAGTLNLNPAVVDVHGRPGRLTVHAAAKEGLIPQRTAQKAVRRVIESLYSAAPPS